MLNQKKRTLIEDAIKRALRAKFDNYDPEAMAKPFHTRLVGKDRVALYSFIHSLFTGFGMAVFEPVAVILAQDRFGVAKGGQKVGTVISKEADVEIGRIVNALGATVAQPDAAAEISAIRKAIERGGGESKVKLRKADLWLEDKERKKVTLVEMKTVKPNISGFEDHKRQLLRWIAAVLHERPDAEVSAIIALPYNPYAPEPYKWWTMRSMYDLQEQVKVAEGFWDFLAGEQVYDDLLDCFERVGIDMREEIDNYFARF